MSDEIRFVRQDLARLEISLGALRDCLQRELLSREEIESVCSRMRRVVALYVDTQIEQQRIQTKKGFYYYLEPDPKGCLCGSGRKIYAKGMCESCYQKARYRLKKEILG